ncbi:MAG: MFS transporter, partial [Pseudomonadota bacterium]
FAIVALMAVSALTLTTTQTSVLFIPVGSAEAPSTLPGLIFYFCGAVIGAAGGTLLSASRTMLVRQAEPGRMGEAFGIYALAGKATSFVAPAAIAIVTDATGDQAIGVTPVILLFAVGLLLMLRVAPDGPGGLRVGAAVAT